MSMPALAILFGLLLDALGVGAYFGTGGVSLTALIPTIPGMILILCGIVGFAAPGARMHVMHVAALIGLLGALGGLGMSVPKLIKLAGGEALERPAAVWLQFGMGVLCALFLFFCIRSFIAARRARLASQS
jgi:hypothetical protein